MIKLHFFESGFSSAILLKMPETRALQVQSLQLYVAALWPLDFKSICMLVI